MRRKSSYPNEKNYRDENYFFFFLFPSFSNRVGIPGKNAQKAYTQISKINEKNNSINVIEPSKLSLFYLTIGYNTVRSNNI
jgi:hypothetical protein